MGALGWLLAVPGWLLSQGTVRAVVVDAGHGGEDSGVLGKGGGTEKEITLRLANMLQAAFKDVTPVGVFLTRDADEHLSLEERAILANRQQPALLLSLHCGYSRRAEETGCRVYYYQPGRSQLDKYHVLKESTPGSTIRLVPWDLAQVGHLSASRELAGILQQKIGALDRSAGGAPTGCALAPLQSIDCPAALVEIGLLSNPSDEARLKDSAYRESVVRALREAVLEFLASPAAKEGRP